MPVGCCMPFLVKKKPTGYARGTACLKEACLPSLPDRPLFDRLATRYTGGLDLTITIKNFLSNINKLSGCLAEIPVIQIAYFNVSIKCLIVDRKNQNTKVVFAAL